MWIKNCTTYENRNNESVQGDYWTQTTTWDKDLDTETTAKD